MTLEVRNNSWQYDDEQIFEVKAVTETNSPLFYHTNTLWNEKVFEEMMRLPSDDDGESYFPWEMYKLYYFKTIEDPETFLDAIFFDQQFGDFVFERTNSNYNPNLCLDGELCDENRVMVYLSKVEMTTKGPKAYISRTDKNLIKRLFETYVPEIKEGVVEIYGLARDTGDRTKICVMTNNPDVDPIGACLGSKGLRVKEINNALNGEKIDIYEYSDNPKELVANALKPAEVLTVNINQKEKSAVAIVPNDQLSLAIGKKGQNARLAVQSSGWKIDIKSLEQANEEGIEY